MKFDLKIEIEVDEIQFLKAFENIEFSTFDKDMETIEDVIKQTIATDIDFTNNVRDNGFVDSAVIELQHSQGLSWYQMECGCS
jgi:hypothetical protein